MGSRNTIGLFNQVWASSGDRSVITDFEIGFGFEYQVDTAPDRRNMNDVLAKTSAVCVDINRYGILPWSSSLIYEVDAYVVGSDGNQYKCLSQNGNNDPVTEDAYWKLFIGLAETYTITPPSGGDLRTFDPNNFTDNQMAAVVATLIKDLS